MKVITAAFFAFSWAALLSTTSGRSALQIIVNIEPRQVAGQGVSDISARVMQKYFPGGRARVEYLTDGRALRSTESAGTTGVGEEEIRLVPGGSSRMYVLNPSARTYYIARDRWGTFDGAKPEVTWRQTGRYRSILGYKAEKVTVSFRQTVRLKTEGRADSSVTREVRADIENWCTGALRVPPTMTKMMDMTRRFVGSDFEYPQTCPLALESTVSISVIPGYQIVSTARSVRRLSRVPAGAFELPSGYREIDLDARSPSR